ncbi:MAG TPA: gephyrin-like molybdotransferase Glp [Candidatus Acidoferrales bacterium]|nr:gephyrin-like molybdotransferase Glp [Candidatus Acidoferrales bacterium]
MLPYDQARAMVIRRVSALRKTTAAEKKPLRAALGFVLAEKIIADRAYPPFNRSTRDGYALRAADVSPGAVLSCAGELKAGDKSTKRLPPGACIQIMTGAAAPPGADAVVMIEQTSRAGDAVTFERGASAGQNIVPRGSEARAGAVLLPSGQRLGFAEIALAAQAGATRPSVHRKPRVAILSTGDEVVPAETTPGPFQIRNSNEFSLAAQTLLTGGEPVELGNAPDQSVALRRRIEKGLRSDVLVLSGGVSMGKYDLVEGVLRELGTRFFFDAVAIRPGRPAVFGICRGVPVFGLPGNPVSTMVTFELFVVPALDILSGAEARPLPLLRAKLAEPVRQKGGLTHFLPARIEWSGGEAAVRELRWKGSGDIAALSRANCFLVVAAEHLEQAAGEWATVLPRRDIL